MGTEDHDQGACKKGEGRGEGDHVSPLIGCKKNPVLGQGKKLQNTRQANNQHKQKGAYIIKGTGRRKQGVDKGKSNNQKGKAIACPHVKLLCGRDDG